MKKDIKRKWTAALNSGEFQQGQGFLRAEEEGQDKYCCLGVLCELYARETGEKWVESPTDTAKGNKKTYGFLGKKAFLPWDVVTWASLGTDDPGEDDESLVTMNDEGKSFQEIAEVIERTL